MKHRLAFGLVLGLAVLIGCQMKTPPPTGLQGGHLLPCPTSPNCVCSQDADANHQVPPIPFTGSSVDALARMKHVILNEPRTRIVSEEPGYLHAEFTSLIFRFTDDVECLIEPGAQVIQIRSASRVGHSDLGVNRKRVERLRLKFAATNAPPSLP